MSENSLLADVYFCIVPDVKLNMVKLNFIYLLKWKEPKTT